jgi:hypothetical protein
MLIKVQQCEPRFDIRSAGSDVIAHFRKIADGMIVWRPMLAAIVECRDLCCRVCDDSAPCCLKIPVLPRSTRRQRLFRLGSLKRWVLLTLHRTAIGLKSGSHR